MARKRRLVKLLKTPTAALDPGNGPQVHSNTTGAQAWEAPDSGGDYWFYCEKNGLERLLLFGYPKQYLAGGRRIWSGISGWDSFSSRLIKALPVPRVQEVKSAPPLDRAISG